MLQNFHTLVFLKLSVEYTHTYTHKTVNVLIYQYVSVKIDDFQKIMRYFTGNQTFIPTRNSPILYNQKVSYPATSRVLCLQLQIITPRKFQFYP